MSFETSQYWGVLLYLSPAAKRTLPATLHKSVRLINRQLARSASSLALFHRRTRALLWTQRECVSTFPTVPSYTQRCGNGTLCASRERRASKSVRLSARERARSLSSGCSRSRVARKWIQCNVKLFVFFCCEGALSVINNIKYLMRRMDNISLHEVVE